MRLSKRICVYQWIVWFLWFEQLLLSPSLAVVQDQVVASNTDSSRTLLGQLVSSPAPIAASRAISPSLLTSAISYTLGEFDICGELRPQVFTLIYVHSAPAHFKHRSVIRRTFGSGSLYTRLKTVTVFFLGQALDKDVALALRAESQRYHDIVQGDYVDSYRNLSLKAISTLKWLKDNCSNAKYVLKIDDDMFVNVFNLVRHLKYLLKYQSDKRPGGEGATQTPQQQRNNNVIHCLVWSKMSVLRNAKSKWYVTKDEYPEDYYPSYCSGSAFFMESSLVPILYEASKAAPFLWVDDVYATGLLAKEANIKHNSINSIVVFKAEEYDSKLIKGEAVFGHMTGDAGVDLRHKYWKKVLLKEEWT